MSSTTTSARAEKAVPIDFVQGFIIAAEKGNRYLSRSGKWVWHNGPEEAWVFSPDEIKTFCSLAAGNGHPYNLLPAYFSAVEKRTVVTGPPQFDSFEL